MIDAPKKVIKRFEALKEERHSQSLQLKHIKNNYYVHSVTSEWDGTRKKAVKVSVHLGAITADGVFTEKSGRHHVLESSREVFEYGNAALAHSMLADAEVILRDGGVPCTGSSLRAPS